MTLRSVDIQGERYAHIGDLLADFERLRKDCLAEDDLTMAVIVGSAAKHIAKTYQVTDVGAEDRMPPQEKQRKAGQFIHGIVKVKPPVRVFLSLLDDDNQAVLSWTLTLDSNQPVVIGRGDGFMVHLDDPKVSLRHAQISCIPYSDPVRWIIEDLGSTNGTWLGSSRVSLGSVLRTGDIIRVGDS